MSLQSLSFFAILKGQWGHYEKDLVVLLLLMTTNVLEDSFLGDKAISLF